MAELILEGRPLRSYFMPVGQDRLPVHEIKHMVDGAKLHLRHTRGDLVINTFGRYSFHGEAAHAFQQTGHAVSNLLLAREDIFTPHFKIERQALGRTLVDSYLHHDSNLLCVAPVCPDYAKDRMLLRSGVSAEAEAGIRGMKATVKALKDARFKPQGVILIADTEDDLEDIMQRSVGGDRRRYITQCEASVAAIQRKLGSVEGVSVMTFSQYFGPAFRERQYAREIELKSLMKQSDSLRRRILRIGESRRDRHAEILGREEQENELAIRYAAQYAAVGDLLRGSATPTIMLNYDTPNRVFVNPHRADRIFPKNNAIPVLGTRIRRIK